MIYKSHLDEILEINYVVIVSSKLVVSFPYFCGEGEVIHILKFLFRNREFFLEKKGKKIKRRRIGWFSYLCVTRVNNGKIFDYGMFEFF